MYGNYQTYSNHDIWVNFTSSITFLSNKIKMKTNYNYISSFLLIHIPCNDLDYLFIYLFIYIYVYIYICKKTYLLKFKLLITSSNFNLFQIIHLSFIYIFFQSLASICYQFNHSITIVQSCY